MKRRARLSLILVLACAALFPLSAPAAPAATITVTTTDDEVENDGDCSLREAIQAANTNAAVDSCPPGGEDDVVILPAGAYTITLPGIEDANAAGDLDIAGSLTLVGAGADVTLINGGGVDRVLHVLSGVVAIHSVTITGGKTPDAASIGGSGDDGGGLYIAAGAFVILANSAVSGNTTGNGGDNLGGNAGRGGRGGGVYNLGTLVLDYGTVHGNITGNGGYSGMGTDGHGGHGGLGGGLYNQGTLMLYHSTVSNNGTGRGGYGEMGGSGGSGGGLYLASGGMATLYASAVVTNTTGYGGDFPGVYIGNGGNGGDGGGLYNQGALVLDHGEVSRNRTGNGGYSHEHGGPGGYGGGLYIAASGVATLTNSAIQSNTTGGGGHTYYMDGGSGGGGGGIFNRGALQVEHCTVSDNTAGEGGYNRLVAGRSGPGGHGGGIGNEGTLTLDDSTVSHNAAGNGGKSANDYSGDGGHGGGIYASFPGTLTLHSSTVSGNIAGAGSQSLRRAGNGGHGGGIYIFSSTLALEHSTVYGNTAGEGGVSDAGSNGRDGDGGGVYGMVHLTNTLLAGNADPGGQAPDCSGQLDSFGHNLVESTTGCTITGILTGNMSGVAPLLGPLAQHGGGTPTHALLLGSPAIDRGNCAGSTADQRGKPRPVDIPGVPNAASGDGCDIGAYEVQRDERYGFYLPLVFRNAP